LNRQPTIEAHGGRGGRGGRGYGGRGYGGRGYGGRGYGGALAVNPLYIYDDYDDYTTPYWYRYIPFYSYYY